MRKITFTMTTLLFSWLLLAASAALADVTKLTSRDKLVHAQYAQYTDGFCNGLSVEVFAGEGIARRDQDLTFSARLFSANRWAQLLH